MRHARTITAVVLTAVAVVAGAGWAVSYSSPEALEHESGGEIYHLVNRSGTLKWVAFSASPESSGYREIDIRYWPVEAAVVPLAILAWWWRMGRRTGGGFPVEPDRRADHLG